MSPRTSSLSLCTGTSFRHARRRKHASVNNAYAVGPSPSLTVFFSSRWTRITSGPARSSPLDSTSITKVPKCATNLRSSELIAEHAAHVQVVDSDGDGPTAYALFTDACL